MVYLLYLNREIGLALFIAFPLAMAFLALTRKTGWKKLVPGALAYFAGFALPYLVLKLTLFAGLGGSYALDWSVLTSAYGLYYIAYAFFYLLTITLIGFFFFPVVLPAIGYRRLGMEKKSLYVLALTALVVSLGIISFTISAQESLGWQMPRMHLRYVSSLFPLFLLLCLAQLESPKALRLRYSPRGLVLLTAGLAVFAGCVAAFLRPFPINNVIDQTMVKWLTDLFLQPRFVIQTGIESANGVVSLSFGALAAKLGVLGGVAILFVLLFTRRKRLLSVCLLAAVVLVSLLNNYFSYSRYYEEYAISGAAQAEGVALYGALEALDGEGILVVTAEATGYGNLLLETYTPAGASFVDAAALLDMAEGGTPLHSVTIGGHSGFTYFVVQNGPYLIEGSVERLDIPGLENYSVYRHIYPGDALFRRAPAFPATEGQTRTITAYEGYFASDFAPHKGEYLSTGEGYLIRRTGGKIEPGVYDVTIHYGYTGPLAGDEVLGTAGLCAAGGEEPFATAPLPAGVSSIRLEQVSVAQPLTDAEMQVFTTVAGVRFLWAEITCTEVYN